MVAAIWRPIATAGADSPEVVRLCQVWNDWVTDVYFAQIVIAYSRLDAIHKLAGGRKPGALSAKTLYVQKLIQAHPNVSAKDLHKFAAADVESQASPFDIGAEGELHERLNGKPMTLRAWEKLLSTAKNP